MCNNNFDKTDPDYKSIAKAFTRIGFNKKTVHVKNNVWKEIAPNRIVQEQISTNVRPLLLRHDYKKLLQENVFPLTKLFDSTMPVT